MTLDTSTETLEIEKTNEPNRSIKLASETYKNSVYDKDILSQWKFNYKKLILVIKNKNNSSFSLPYSWTSIPD